MSDLCPGAAIPPKVLHQLQQSCDWRSKYFAIGLIPLAGPSLQESPAKALQDAKERLSAAQDDVDAACRSLDEALTEKLPGQRAKLEQLVALLKDPDGFVPATMADAAEALLERQVILIVYLAAMSMVLLAIIFCYR